MHYAQTILPLNVRGLFTYKIPDEFTGKIKPGMRVLLPFGGIKIYTAIVSDITVKAPENFIPKEIIGVLDDQEILPSAQLAFWKWLAEYYLCNIGEIYRLAFPSSLKLESETYLKLKPGANIDLEHLDVNETYLLQALEVRQVINLTDIEAFIPKKDLIKTVRSLLDLQYIEIDEKISEKYRAKQISCVRIEQQLFSSENLSQIISGLGRAAKQKELFLYILHKQTEHPEKLVKKSDLLAEQLFAPAHLKALIDKKLITEYFVDTERLTYFEGATEALDELSDSQKEVNEKINHAFHENKNVLLHGVTSSGKTHIYLENIENCFKNDKNTLFLLPEISLTKQIIIRLEKKYGRSLGFYHQKMTDFEKVEVWRRIKKNEIKVLVGTRNALFLPFQNLGLIIVDEEHDSAYRPKEVSPYFSGRDAAVVLGNLYHAKVILGSATPSVETYYAAKKGKLAYIPLQERYKNVALPEFNLINFKEAQDSKKIIGNFSLQLCDEVRNNLQNKNQTMILHNRRGYASVIECETCGYVHYCSNCDVVLTFHKSANEMKCHYCGQRASKPRTCSKCHSENLNERGVGVEQIHEELSKIFPEAEIDRMDVDSMRKKFAYEKLYEKIASQQTDIIVGTQMISKGLDFDNIELVAIPKADAMLHVQDFRAEERAYQLITQISGRAGRVSGKGKIYIQTYHPEHPLYQLITQQNAAKIYKHFLTERQQFHYPPFTKLIMIELKHRKEDKVNRASQFMGSVLRKYLPEECILGPERCQIARLNTLYQFQILLKLPRGKRYQMYKNKVLTSLEEFDEITAYQSIKKNIYVDY